MGTPPPPPTAAPLPRGVGTRKNGQNLKAGTHKIGRIEGMIRKTEGRKRRKKGVEEGKVEGEGWRGGKM